MEIRWFVLTKETPMASKTNKKENEVTKEERMSGEKIKREHTMLKMHMARF